MENYKILESYRIGTLQLKNDKDLDEVSKQLKSKVRENISEKFLQKFLKSEKTITKIENNLDKQIKTEFNSISIPYFYILESINLCIEVEMSDSHTQFTNGQKFGEKKFSDIQNNGGFENPQPIKKFTISEKEFIGEITSLVEKYTRNFEITEDSVKIEVV
jgi:hypothetical protein